MVDLPFSCLYNHPIETKQGLPQMVKYCEVFKTAVEAFESAAMHEIITTLGPCKLGKQNGIWYVIWGY